MRRLQQHSVFYSPFLAMLFSVSLFGVAPVRGASGNGSNPDAAAWNLLGRSRTISLAAVGKQVNMRRQTVCLNEDVENSLPRPTPQLTGTCHSGVYLHLFQFESSSLNVTVSVGDIAVDPAYPQNYGVLLCDNHSPLTDTDNTLELCTNWKGSLPDITVSMAKNAVGFAVPNFPAYPKGIQNQGRGLTLYVIVQQKAALPVQIPMVAIY